MIKNKSMMVVAGVTTLLGMIGGTAFIASAQGAPANVVIPPAGAVAHASRSNTADLPESPNDQADTDTSVQDALQGTSVSTTSVSAEHSDGTNEANDTDGSASSEANETGSASDAAE